jgi:NAD(P)-dependent dehydrogenase (short-subunit alcohol dehydrogenase family)
MLTNMEESEWDAVINVHLKGTFGPTKHAAAYWREQSKAGNPVAGRIVNTSSPSGVFGNAGQTNYGAAKAGIAAFTIICGLELGRYGVLANAIAPVARTRMTEDLGFGAAPEGKWDALDPANISPTVVWLGSNDNTDVTGRVFLVDGDRVSVAEGWRRGPTARNDQMRWEPAQLTKVIPDLVSQAEPNSTMLS